MTTIISLVNSARKHQELLGRMTTIISLVKLAREHQESLQKFFDDNIKLSIIFKEDIRLYLSNRGWYIAGSLYSNQYIPIKDAIQNDDEEGVEKLLIQHIRSRVDEIETTSINAWPSRAFIINDAFEAHRNTKYTLSIPTMLAQADGICHDIFEVHLFTNRDGSVSDKAKGLTNSGAVSSPLASAFLDLLIEHSSIRTDTKKRDNNQKVDQYYGPINRHGILHGIDIDYATEANSLRAIALISFLNWVNEII